MIRSLCALTTALPVFAASPDFREDIQPILESNCVRCHSESKVKGGLRLDTHEMIMEGGDTADADDNGDINTSAAADEAAASFRLEQINVFRLGAQTFLILVPHFHERFRSFSDQTEYVCRIVLILFPGWMKMGI